MLSFGNLERLVRLADFPNWDGTTVREVGIDSSDERCAVVRFERPSIHSLGPPNGQRFLEGKRHFIITFHDSVFECVARGYTVEVVRGSIKDLLVSHVQQMDA